MKRRPLVALLCATVLWLVAGPVEAQSAVVPSVPAWVVVMNPTGDALVPVALLSRVRSELEDLVRARPDLRLAAAPTGGAPFATGRGFVVAAHVRMTFPHATVELKIRPAPSQGLPTTTFGTASIGGHSPRGRAWEEAEVVAGAARGAWRGVAARIRP